MSHIKTIENRYSFPLFWKLLFFIFLFSYFYPEQYKAIPISNVRFLQLLGCLFFITYSLLRRKINYNIINIWIYGIIILFSGIFSTIINQTSEYEFALRGLYIILYTVSAYFLMYLLNRFKNNATIYDLLEWIIYITIIQAIVSFVFFFCPDIFKAYQELIVLDEFNEKMLSRFAEFRLIGIGSVRYAGAAVQYGLVIWITIFLKIKERGTIQKYKILYFGSIFLFCIAGAFSGRTFFIILFLTIFYVFYLNGKNKIKYSSKIIASIFIPLFIGGVLLFTYLIIEYEEAVNWIFELFINWIDGKVETNSTNKLFEMYIFPDNIGTWLFGDGRTTDNDMGFYKSTDVGYTRSLFYWGICGSLIYFSFQYYLYRIIKRKTQDVYLRRMFLMLLIWYYIYNLKDFWRIEQFFILFFVALVYNSNWFDKKEIKHI